MTIKEKFTELKKKIKNNRTSILAVASTGAAIVTAVLLIQEKKDHTSDLENHSKTLNEFKDHLEKLCTHETILRLTQDDRQKLKEDPKNAIIFQFEEDKFDVMYCTPEHSDL